MKIIVCVDDNNGMLFNKRRQSKDSVQLENLLKLVGDGKLWVNEYSYGLFPHNDNIICDNDYMSKANDDDYCFIENAVEEIDRADTIIMYKWNRTYPSDVKFPFNPIENGWILQETEDFAGSSHEKITREVYKNE